MTVLEELFANPGTAANPVVTSGGATTPVSGTPETWTVTGLAGVFPAISNAAAPPSFCRCCDPALPSEILWITNISGTTATVTRGAEGSTPVSHAASFQLELLITAGGLGSFAQGWPGLVSTLVAKSAAYTATAADNIIVCNATTAAFTITLPTAVGALGRTYTIKKTDATGNGVTVDPNGAQTIDGAVTITLSRQWQYIQIVSDGANWQIVDSALFIDTTAADIAALGTQAAGATGLAADAGHVHQMPRHDQLAAPTASVAWGSQKITSLANGVAGTDAAAFGQIPVVDATVADLQSPGIAAAGGTGKWADAGHVHPLPSASISSSVAVGTTDIVVVKLPIKAAQLAVGSTFYCLMMGLWSNGASSTAQTITLRAGTAGSTADASIGSASPSNNASAITNTGLKIEILITLQSTGTTGAAAAQMFSFTTAASFVGQAVGAPAFAMTATWNTATATFLTVTFKCGTGNSYSINEALFEQRK